MDSTQLTPHVVIDHGPVGLRVIATDTIATGEPLFRVVGRPVSRADKYSIQIGPRAHLTPDGAPWSLVNHACLPNTAINFERWELFAVRPIESGEELGWNYLTTEWELSSPFTCQCGDKACERIIRGFRYLSVERRTALRPLLSPYLRSRFL